ncbi:sodium/glutamate symporter [Helicobacter mustelae]|uniref:Sodium/glutamate symporter n=1 Tax=Helicobacter mustelae (strain ATCC 43772 / CCUG 25715 / CIP 103759 / LMG 18044 / NCTC 12198 / R85-136P) TaxID=679897 RepID=D3UHV3_HELM1|nr:sodium/glutamate symporter [Helicobacter mustelae]CBG40076.1 sodium/glutamate symport carrier protein [Helicobacter mustelae 12198]SQH71590.1 sodium/glutamate symport carrier protein [Helicobacter mustelae]STP12714.1 sodium/glutamate symport carrier protein [Helicobacter mustelae]
MKLDFYATLSCMVAVLLIGRFVLRRIKFLRDYNIPEPVVGGLLVAICITIAFKGFGFHIQFDTSLQGPLMLAFFSSIGLNADFASLKKGGGTLVKFLIVVSIFLVAQNLIGVALALGMHQNPLLGLLGGSITMSGGHGTGAAWAATFKESPYFLENGLELAIACATFGLILGGIIGGPVARFLIHAYKLSPKDKEDKDFSGFESPGSMRLITAQSFVESLALIAIALLVGTKIAELLKGTSFSLPTFVWCLFVSVILRNTLSAFKFHQVFEREVSVIGNVSLSLFLASALMTLKLWELANLALPLLILLITQTVLMILYAIFVTFRTMGKDYDAAVLAAGHCGFGLGATPTAIVNMQTITQRYGPSHVAFLVVPMVGAFFIDILNALVIKFFLSLPIFT